MKYAVSLLFLLFTSCTAAQNWDVSNLPCDEHQACLEHYSCVPEGSGSICVRDASRQRDQICLADRQCAAGLVCGGTCVQACAPHDAFLQADACAEEQVCRNIGDPMAPKAACVSSDSCIGGARCITDDTPDGGVCVPISTTAQACLPGCTIDWTTGIYHDSCAADELCQPVGLADQLYLVCSASSPGEAVAGSSCSNAVGQPCAAGLACIDGVCRLHCDASGGVTVCGEGSACVAIPLAAASTQRQFGYCSGSSL